MTYEQEEGQAVFSMFAAYGAYLLSVFGLRPLLLRHGVTYTAQKFKATYPRGAWLIGLHEVLSIPAFLGSLVGLPLVGKLVLNIPLDFGAAAWLVVSGLNLFNGLFELMTGVCPGYGVVIKHHEHQDYIVSRGVRRLGVIRIGLSFVILGVLWWTARH